MRRSTTGMLATSALLGVALLVPTPALAVDGEFSAEANGSQLFVDAVNFGALTAEPPVGSLAQIGVAPTLGEVDTAGLGDGVLSHAFGQNLDVSLLDQQLPLDQLSTAEQTAPEDNPERTVSQLIPLDAASPLLTGSVLESTAWARTPSAVECPDQDGRSVISEGTSTTTDLGVLDLSEFQEGMGPLVSVQGAGEGTLTSASGTYVASDGAVIAESRAQTAEVNVANELRIEVVNPTLTAVAGRGDGSLTYTGEVRINGDKIAGLQENTLSLEALREILLPLDEQALNTLFGPLDENVVNPLLEPLAEALPLLDGEQLTGEQLVGLIDDGAIDLEQLAFLEPTVLVTAGQVENRDVSATHASGEVKTVRVELNLVSTLTETEVPILSVHLMPLSVSATAPAGGLECGAEDDGNPIAVRKDASSQTVRPGQSFDYQITVENRGSCPLQDVTVTEEVFLNGAPFTGTITADEATSNSGGVVTFERDSLAPGEIATYTLTIDVPSEANGTFLDEVAADGVCDQEDVTATDVFSGPGITSDASDEGCDVSTSSKQATHREVRPGQQYAYVLRVANTGGEDCGQTTVRDTLPDNVDYVSCSPNDCDVSGQTVTFVLDGLPSGASEVLTITVTAPDDAEADIADNVAVIEPTADTGDPVTIDAPSPDVTDNPVFTSPDLGSFVPDQTGQAGGEAPTNLPRTGGGAAMLALGALAAAGALRRRS